MVDSSQDSSTASIRSRKSGMSDSSIHSPSKSHMLVRHDRARTSPKDSNYYYAKKVSESASLNVSSSTTGYDPLVDQSLAHESSGSLPLSSQTRISLNSVDTNVSSHDGCRVSRFSERFDISLSPFKAADVDVKSSPSIYEDDDDDDSTTGSTSTNTNSSKSSKEADLKGKSKNPGKVKFSSHLLQYCYSYSGKDSKPQFPSSSDDSDIPPPPFPIKYTLSLWTLYCRLVTIGVCSWLLKKCGIKSKPAQDAWREKIGLLSIIIFLTILVGFFTFGFNTWLCASTDQRIHFREVNNDCVVIHGRVLNVTDFTHEYYDRNAGVRLPPLLSQYPEIGGKDISFLFQNVNWNCYGLISPRARNRIPKTQYDEVPWYFPCRVLGVVNDLFDVYAEQPSTDPETLLQSSPYRRKKIQEIVMKNYNATRHMKRDTYNNLTALEWQDTVEVAAAPIRANSSYYTESNAIGSAVTTKPRKPDYRARGYGCHITSYSREKFYRMPTIGDVVYTWDDVLYNPSLVVINQNVISLDRLEHLDKRIWRLDPLLNMPFEFEGLPADLSLVFATSPQHKKAGRCLVELAKVGIIDSETVGCLVAQSVLYLSLVFIVSIVVLKFLFALYFEWFLSPKMVTDSFCGEQQATRNPFARLGNDQASVISISDNESNNLVPGLQPKKMEWFNNDMMKVLCLVTVYRESEEGLKQCFDSLANTVYPNSNKVLVVICDGMVSVSDDASTMTYEQILRMMVPLESEQAIGKQDNLVYESVGRGQDHINLATIYYGLYKRLNNNDSCSNSNADNDDDAMTSTTISAGSTSPSATSTTDYTDYVGMICIVKKGNFYERSNKGNRGKRDSQVMLMSFLEKVLLRERMSSFQNELYYAFIKVCGFDPSLFEAVMMIDADTKVYPDSLALMTACLKADPYIMGVCGETMIQNKTESWVTMIQVFEYFISHHLNKSFESVFGGVTCLPGCFSMYRIKTFKKTQHWLPILVNPDVVIRYSVNKIDSLHLKNLLLLGEDRYLSTLMLKTFPRRKLVFLPRAKCTTVAPSSFHVLVDQRRRWINSTIHNLLELFLVRDLCGVFCISMQAVVFIELVGTITLPAALVFFLYFLVSSFYKRPVAIIPLTLLICIIGIPGLLIFVTTKDWRFLLWMLVYLFSLPVWNLILPLNSCECP